jgi:hypothetical protein
MLMGGSCTYDRQLGIISVGTAVTKGRDVWFHRMIAWNNQSYHWPCHWKGWLILLSTTTIALGSFFLITTSANHFKHPELGWLSVLVVIAQYSIFGVIAERHSR